MKSESTVLTGGIVRAVHGNYAVNLAISGEPPISGPISTPPAMEQAFGSA